MGVVTVAVDVARPCKAVENAGAAGRAIAVAVRAYPRAPVVSPAVHMARCASALKITFAARAADAFPVRAFSFAVGSFVMTNNPARR